MTEHEGIKYPEGADRKALESGHAHAIEKHESSMYLARYWVPLTR
jgi:hypothetical protein